MNMVTSNGTTESNDSMIRNNSTDGSTPFIHLPRKDDKDYPMDDADGDENDSNYVYIKITCPNLGPKYSKTFRFCLHEIVWIAKQTVLVEFASNPNMHDPLNFGFYLPPHAGRAGKFLDEERKMSEYPMDNVQAHLEFRYKRRIFRHLYTPDDKKLAKANSKKSQKKFIEELYGRNIPELQKMFEKGLDPNFHEERTGDTPLMIAAMMDNCLDLLKLLIQFGAYLDFRSVKGKTALHMVAAAGRLEVLKNFKALGASSNYKDGKGLTPLYHSILCSADISIAEHLLNEKARIGVTDIHGSEEIHQACKLGLARHLELLILHGSNVNSRTASGNTPLHICVLENQMTCAKILLRHGADHHISNYAQQSAYDVSILSNHFEIGKMLRQLDGDLSTETMSVGSPEVSNKEAAMVCSKSYSDSALPVEPSSYGLLNGDGETEKKIIGTTNLSRLNASKDAASHDEASDSESDSDDEEKLKPEKPCRTFSNAGIGTKRAPAPMKIKPIGTPMLQKRLYASVPGRQFLAVNDYEPKHSGELALKKGDILEVLYIGDNGFWEGHLNGRGGWFPSYCVQEIKHNDNHLPRQLSWFGKKSPTTEEAPTQLLRGYPPTARMVHLKRSDKGFGFQLRGANSHVPYINFVPSPQYPALQYIGDVDKGGVAEKVGVKAGDFVLEINGENIINATHGYAVSLINKYSEQGLMLKIITVVPEIVTAADVVVTTIGAKTSRANTMEVGDSVDGNVGAGGTLSAKPGPPTPPMRSFQTALSLPSRMHGDASLLLAEGAVATTAAETVTLGKPSVARKPSVKGIWSGNAFRLQGNDVKIREENISRGISRKQKGVSTTSDKIPEYEELCKVLPSKLPSFSRELSRKSDSNDPPPDYHSTIENLRTGRANSIGKGDGIKLTRSMTLDNTNQQLTPTSKNHNKPQRSETYTQRDYENQNFATLRKHNIPPKPVKPDRLSRAVSQQGSINQSPINNVRSQSINSVIAQQAQLQQQRRVSSTSSNEIEFEPPDYDITVSNHAAGGKEGDGDDSSIDEIPPIPPAAAESDGLLRMQRLRQESVSGKPPVLPKPVLVKQQELSPRNDSSSCASTDSIYSKDSGYEDMSGAVAALLAADKLNNNCGDATDAVTTYLDDVIADAEASLILDDSPTSSSRVEVDDCSSGSNSVLSSPTLSADTEGRGNGGCTSPEFPPIPEFLSDDVVDGKKGDEKKSCQVNEPPPPYTPFSEEKAPSIVNVPSTLQSKAYMEWTCADVCEWLDHLSLGQYRETFIDNDIEGKHLAELTKDELKELGVTKLGHRMTLDDAIAKLCRNAP